MSKLRIWKLGKYNHRHPEKSIFPSMKAISRLRDLIAGSKNADGGTMDLVWGPELDVQEFESLDVINLIETSDGKYERVEDD